MVHNLDEMTEADLPSEIAELMQMKSKHGGGGEFAPDWRPKVPIVEPPPPTVEAPPPAPPGWRVVHKRPECKPRMIKAKAPAPASAPAPPPPKPELPAWAHWRPNPLLAPTPISPTKVMSPVPPARTGLFGPSTPPPK